MIIHFNRTLLIQQIINVINQICSHKLPNQTQKVCCMSLLQKAWYAPATMDDDGLIDTQIGAFKEKNFSKDLHCFRL